MPHRRSISPTKYKDIDDTPDIIDDISNLTHPDYIEEFEEPNRGTINLNCIYFFLIVIYFWNLLQNSQPGKAKDSTP